MFTKLNNSRRKYKRNWRLIRMGFTAARLVNSLLTDTLSWLVLKSMTVKIHTNIPFQLVNVKLNHPKGPFT